MNKETITFGEFRSWLTGLILGKRGALPDLDDWKEIKKMMDKVEEKGVEYVPLPYKEPNPGIQPFDVIGPGLYPPSITTPNTSPSWQPFTTWCSSSADMNVTWAGDPSVMTASAMGTCTDPAKVEQTLFDHDTFMAAVDQMFAHENYSSDGSADMHEQLRLWNTKQDD